MSRKPAQTAPDTPSLPAAPTLPRQGGSYTRTPDGALTPNTGKED